MKIRTLVAAAAMLVSLSACNATNGNTLALSALTGAAGALGGSQFGKGKGKLIATGAGALLGAATGAFVGNKWDTINHNQAAVVGLEQQQQEQQHITNIYQQGNDGASSTNGNQQLHLKCRVERNYVVCGSQ